MYSITIVGIGSLGSNLAIEIAKRSGAIDFPLKLTLIDDDQVEDRNLYSQDFFPNDVGKPKAEVIAERCAQYPLLEVTSHVTRVEDENASEILQLDHQSILVDAVDNLQTRQMLYMHGLLYEIPVLHLGMSPQTGGNISWNFKECDTFPLSPLQLAPDKREEVLANIQGDMPPCELNSFRSLIVNTSLAALNSLFIALGVDTLGMIGEDIVPGTLTSWNSSVEGFGMVKPLTFTANWLKSQEELELREVLNSFSVV